MLWARRNTTAVRSLFSADGMRFLRKPLNQTPQTRMYCTWPLLANRSPGG